MSYKEITDAMRYCRASDLINRQKAEIERLKQIIDEQNKEIIKLQKRIIFWRDDLNYQLEKIKSDAIKEFVEKLKKIIYTQMNRTDYDGVVLLTRIDNSIDNLVKEMVEVQSNES